MLLNLKCFFPPSLLLNFCRKTKNHLHSRVGYRNAPRALEKVLGRNVRNESMFLGYPLNPSLYLIQHQKDSVVTTPMVSRVLAAMAVHHELVQSSACSSCAPEAEEITKSNQH